VSPYRSTYEHHISVDDKLQAGTVVQLGTGTAQELGYDLTHITTCTMDHRHWDRTLLRSIM